MEILQTCMIALILLSNSVVFGEASCENTAEARQLILDELSGLNLTDDNLTKTPVYRMDLDPDYAAYCLVEVDGKYYALISAGTKTGGADLPLHGDISPESSSPLKALSGDCAVYYLLSPAGDLACKDAEGTFIDASFADDEQYKAETGWTDLDYHITSEYKNQFEEAAENDSPTNTKKRNTGYELEKEGFKCNATNFTIYSIKPGYSQKVVGNDVTKIIIRYNPVVGETAEKIKKFQDKVCQAVDNCEKEGKVGIIPISQIVDEKFTLSINISADKILNGKVFSVETYKDTNILQCFTFEFFYPPAAKGYDYTSWSRYSTRYVTLRNMIPRYSQSRYRECYPGTVAVAWATIFGFYNRRSLINQNYKGKELYRFGFDGMYDSVNVAPYRPDSRMKDYMRNLGMIVRANCNGVTYDSSVANVETFFGERQGGSPKIERYKSGTVNTGGTNFIFEKIKKDFPVLTWVKSGSSYADKVAFGIKSQWRRKRWCIVASLNIGCQSWKTERRGTMYVSHLNGGALTWITMATRHAWAAMY